MQASTYNLKQFSRFEVLSAMTQRFAFVLILLICSISPALAQLPYPAPNMGQPQQTNEQEDKMKREQAKKFNKERHLNLKKDTDKLLALATELKQYVDKSNENVLSVDVVKKAEEIEKLAHSVKDKMKAN